jgi:DNA modification methylase
MTTVANSTPEDAGLTWSIRVGDVLERLLELPGESAQCVVTSPPYWGLRDYGTATWEGGEAGCDHAPERRGGRFASPVSEKQAINTGSGSASMRDCPCGARRIDAQLGLEPTPEEYVAKMVAVFAEVRRVLRANGTLWLNIGDSYANTGFRSGIANNGGFTGREQRENVGYRPSPPKEIPPGLKPKDLVGIPWRLAFALQADGWYLRSDIIWSKPNPMPESVTDRPTKAHEYLFLLTKAPRYYFDQEAVREEAIRAGDGNYGDRQVGDGYVSGGWLKGGTVPAGRNVRSVWTIATQPFPEAHFATFPEALVEPCIKAGSRQDDTILDPFAGSGTTGVVALKLGRSFVGLELNPTYAEMARRRVGNTAPLLAREVA